MQCLVGKNDLFLLEMGWNESTFLTVKRSSRVHVIQNIHS